jgi:DNA-binding PadR family transcriptional regulator
MKKADSVGQFEQIVLAAISMLRNEAYGLAIHAKISELAGRPVNLGAMYTTLDRLEDKGYIRSEEKEATPERGGRPKRYCYLEAAGAEALRESIATSQRVIEGVKEPWILGKRRPRRATE